MILTAGMRRKIPKSKFGIPGQRAYPMPDKAHATAALRLVGRGIAAGHVSPSQAAHIRAMAHGILSGKKK